MSPVTLGLVTTAQERALWRELVERYHYLGHKVPYGAHLRYLVWISTPGAELAGCVQFSSAARVMVEDWEEAYGLKPALLETFVDRERYEGTCYRAANWIDVGETTGRGRMDRDRTAAGPVKTCLVYPLTDDFRRRLGGEGRG